METSSFDNCVRNQSIEILNIFYPELQLINIKTIIENKLKDFLGEFKKFKTQTILVLEYKKIDYHKSIHKIFHLSARLIANDSNSDIVFGSMHVSVMTRIKRFVSVDWFVKKNCGA